MIFFNGFHFWNITNSIRFDLKIFDFPFAPSLLRFAKEREAVSKIFDIKDFQKNATFFYFNKKYNIKDLFLKKK